METIEQKKIAQNIIEQLTRELPFFQVLIGPRQVGKTTTAKRIIEELGWSNHYAIADSPVPRGPEWIHEQWKIALEKAEQSSSPVLLVLDEVQKVQGWSEVVKLLWDTHRSGGKIKLLILGSSALLIQKGLTESLAGRFFLHRAMHWSFNECQEGFGMTLDQWLYFGGYPGAAGLISDESLWRNYIGNALIETVLARDVIQMQNIHKPTLLRHLFALSANYPAQILSYNKMLGQLQEAGNTATLAHYVYLLQSAFLLSGLQLFSKGVIRQKSSHPKLIVWNNALVSAIAPYSFAEAIADPRWYGHLVENAVGAHLLNHLTDLMWNVHYWRKGPHEIDFVVTRGQKIFALEVKTSQSDAGKNFAAFKREYPDAHTILIGPDELPEFFSKKPQDLLGKDYAPY